MRKTIEIGRKKEKMGRMKGKRDEAWHRERVAVFMGQRQKSSETCKTTQIKGNEHKNGLKILRSIRQKSYFRVDYPWRNIDSRS